MKTIRMRFIFLTMAVWILPVLADEFRYVINTRDHGDHMAGNELAPSR